MNNTSKFILIIDSIMTLYISFLFNGVPELGFNGLFTLIGGVIGIGLITIGPSFLYVGIVYLFNKKFENKGFSIILTSCILLSSYIVIYPRL